MMEVKSTESSTAVDAAGIASATTSPAKINSVKESPRSAVARPQSGDVERNPASRMRIRFSDCDPFGHLNNARYLDYFIETRTDHLRREYDFDVFEHGSQTGRNWVVTGTRVAYLKPARCNDEVRIVTRLLQFDTHTLRYEGVMESASGGRPLAVSWVDFAYIRMDNGRPARYDEQLSAFLDSIVLRDESSAGAPTGADPFYERVRKIIEASRGESK